MHMQSTAAEAGSQRRYLCSVKHHVRQAPRREALQTVTAQGQQHKQQRMLECGKTTAGRAPILQEEGVQVGVEHFGVTAWRPKRGQNKGTIAVAAENCKWPRSQHATLRLSQTP